MSDRPHVVHIIDELPRDGAEVLLLDLVRRRDARMRYSVLCLVRGGPLVEEFERAGVPVVVFGRRGAVDPRMLWRLVRWLRREHATVVHTHLFTADSYGRLAARLAGVGAVFSTVHNSVGPPGRLRKLANRVLARLSDSVIGCGDEIAAALESQGVPAQRILSIPNGIDLQRFQGAQGAGVREEFGVQAGRVVLGMVGRLHVQKGHEVLLECLAGMSETQRRAVACLVIGVGELEQRLRSRVEQLGLEDVVTFTGSRTDVPRLVAALDVFVMPSLWEGLPIALLEAMASGRAVLCSSVGSIPGVVQHGENGWLVEPGNVQALREAILTLVDDPGLRARLGRRAREQVIARFDVERTAAAYNRLHARAAGLDAAEPSA